MFRINHRTIHLMLASAHLAVFLGWIDHIDVMMVVAYTLLGLSKH